MHHGEFFFYLLFMLFTYLVSGLCSFSSCFVGWFYVHLNSRTESMVLNLLLVISGLASHVISRFLPLVLLTPIDASSSSAYYFVF